jgi:hypothetical protein
MGKCDSVITELRFVFEAELTQVYVACSAVGDCPMGVQGWHHKTFPASRPADDILAKDVHKYLEWAQEAPDIV